MNNLKKYQKHILNTYNAEYKYNLIQKSISYFDDKIEKGEFQFFNIGSNLDDIYTKWSTSYNFLENELVKNIDTDLVNKHGYNRKLIDALLYNPPDWLIFHTEMFNFVNDIYTKHFSNLSEFEIYNIITTFDINEFTPSNYLKVCYDSDLINYEHLPRVFYFHLNPLYILSKSLINQIATSIRRETYYDLKDFDIKNNLKLNNIHYLNQKTSDFVINNIYNDIKFNDYYEEDILESLNLSNIENLFNNYIDKFVSSNDFIKFSSMVFDDYTYDYMYKLYLDEDGIEFAIPDNIKAKFDEATKNKFLSIKASNEQRSIVSITYKYRHDYLQFINSTLFIFSEWLDLILENQKEDIHFDHYLSLNDVREIIKSISFDYDQFLEYTNNNFLNDFLNSKTIENVLYKYVENIVELFIQTKEFKNYILLDIIPVLSRSLKTRSPKLYSEIYDNIDKIKMYIKYLLVKHIVNNNNLHVSYRDILMAKANVYKFDDFLLENIVTNFYNIDDKSVITLQQEYSKFITSMSHLLFFDMYMDSFRLVKKYMNINSQEKIISSPYR